MSRRQSDCDEPAIGDAGEMDRLVRKMLKGTNKVVGEVISRQVLGWVGTIAQQDEALIAG
jgi:hypothetical protein